MQDYDAVIYQVGERGDLRDADGRAAEFVAVALMQPGAKLTVSIGGYDDDPRELFDIPEVMEFMRAFVGAIGERLPGSRILSVFDRLSYECRALMLLAAGAVSRDQIRITTEDQEGSIYR